MKKYFFLAAFALAVSCTGTKGPELLPREAYQAEYQGKQLDLYTIGSSEVTVQLTNLGARVVALYTKDRDGNYDDIAVGYENIERYINNTGNRSYGATIGRVTNRIAGGSFELDGTTYQLSQNSGANCFHGGFTGADYLAWDAVECSDNSVTFHVVFPDGLDGFPGNLDATVKYSVCGADLCIDYAATTDKPTIVNFTNHTYFNLKGQRGGTVLDNEIRISADEYYECENGMPTGKLIPVEGTANDFRTAKVLGDTIDGGWHLSGYDGTLRNVFSLYEPVTGRVMETLTDQPCLWFYSAPKLKGDFYGKRPDAPLMGNEMIAVEAQKPVDAVHHPGFEQIVLRPGETYAQHTIYRFSAK